MLKQAWQRSLVSPLSPTFRHSVEQVEVQMSFTLGKSLGPMALHIFTLDFLTDPSTVSSDGSGDMMPAGVEPAWQSTPV